jgi:hypothetical protein
MLILLMPLALIRRQRHAADIRWQPALFSAVIAERFRRRQPLIFGAFRQSAKPAAALSARAALLPLLLSSMLQTCRYYFRREAGHIEPLFHFLSPLRHCAARYYRLLSRQRAAAASRQPIRFRLSFLRLRFSADAADAAFSL